MLLLFVFSYLVPKENYRRYFNFFISVTKLLKGFKSKQGKSFDAVVAFDGEYNTTFVFPEAKKDKKFSGRKK